MIFESSGIKTYYEEYGEKNAPTLLLLHGIGADNNMWNPQKKTFPSKGYRVIIPDLLAHGKSSKVKSLELLDWSKQLLNLLDFLKIQKVTVVGVSMGGVIAQHFVVNYPDRVDKIIISDSFGELKTVKEKLLGFSQVIGFKLFKLIGKKALAKGMAATYKVDYAYLARDYFKKTCLNLDLNQMVLARKAINRIDILEHLKSVKSPSLVMCGDKFGKSFININKKIAKALDTELVIINGAMDPSNLVKPIEFDEQVFKFISNHEN